MPLQSPTRLAPIGVLLAVAVAVAVAACSGGEGTGPGSIDDDPDCVANPSACAPPLTGAELESAYMDSLNVLLDTGAGFAAALEWIRAQDQVTEADADDHALFFRLAGGEPLFLLDIDAHPVEGGVPSPAGLPGARSRPPGVWGPKNIVVGKGTGREDPQNRKQALFLEPFRWQWGDRFGPHAAELRTIPDYAWGAGAIWHETDGDVDPFIFGLFDTFDAIFVSTHGAQFDGATWLSTGVLKEYGPDEFDQVCAEIGQVYVGTPGARCGGLRHANKNYVAVGLQTPFFQAAYGTNGGLQRAVVYMGGCNTNRNDNWYLADALAGGTSAYYGWDNSVWSSKHPSAIYAILYMLINRRATTQNALDVACMANQCGGPSWGPPPGANLRLYQNGEAARTLRLYDPPTLKDPRVPTSILGLQPGDTLLIEGVAGDGVRDSLRMMVDVTGVIDPNDTSGRPLGVGGGAAAGGQGTNPADLYDLGFMVDGQAVGSDNLGNPRPEASVSQINATTWRYAYTAELPFDLPEDGQTATLKVEGPLPEGGKGDYEVDVFLKDPLCTFRLALGNQVIRAQPGDEMVFNTDNGRLWNVSVRRPSVGWDLRMLPPDNDPASRPDAPGTWPMVIQGDMGLTDPDDAIYATDPPPAATLVLDRLVPHERVRGSVSGPVYVVSTSNPRTLHADWSFAIRYERGQFKCTVGGT